jgi:diaminopimelate epimerase
MTGVAFEKYEGLGNDFIVVDAPSPVGQERARRLCDRHFGVGADGVLVVAPPVTAGARATMIVENADGSRPEMCGNGLRCVALHLALQSGTARSEFVVDTDAGPRRVFVDRDGDSAQVLIDMGRAQIVGEHRTPFEGRELVFQRVSVGNPHAIRYGESFPVEVVDRIGPQVSAAIAGGSNVEFVVRRGPAAFDIVVWERGVGRTLACGTGAVATAAALATAGHADFDVPLEMHLPGGPLEVWVAKDTLETRLRGPARRVFGGELS